METLAFIGGGNMAGAIVGGLVRSGRAPASVIVVDPGDGAPVLRYLQDQALNLSAILVTHHHPDHIAGIPALLADLPNPTLAALVIAASLSLVDPPGMLRLRRPRRRISHALARDGRGNGAAAPPLGVALGQRARFGFGLRGTTPHAPHQRAAATRGQGAAAALA